MTSLHLTPVQIILNATIEKDHGRLDNFKKNIELLYRFKVFKPMLDLCATLCRNGRLRFIIKIKDNFDLDAGNCRTVDSNSLDRITNSFRRVKNYTITIKQISGYVIIHEIGHMIEKELEVDLTNFKEKIIQDINSGNFSRALLISAKKILIEEVQQYPLEQRLSEVFTRFFELIARSNEISGKQIQTTFSVNDVITGFSNLMKFSNEKVFASINNLVAQDIALASNQYVQDITSIVHNWADSKIEAKHSDAKKPIWSKVIKSIDD